jgi:hypothetical protein
MPSRLPSLIASTLTLTAAVGALAAASSAGAAPVVYMSTIESSGSGGVRAWTVGDASSSLLFQVPAGSGYAAMGVGVDSTSDLVYAAGQTTGNAAYVARGSASSASTPTTLWQGTAGSSYGTDLVIDGGDGRVYWPYVDSGVAYTSTGSTLGSTLTVDNNAPGPVASAVIGLNSANGYLYWTQSAASSPSTYRSLAPLMPSRIPFTSATPSNDNVQSMAFNRAGTTAYQATCTTRVQVASTTCTGAVTRKSISAGTGDAPSTWTTSSITDLSAIAVDSDDCILFGTSGAAGSAGVIGRAATTGCTAATLFTLPANTRITSLWVVEAPTATAAPSVTGSSSSTGATLTCSDATWADDLTGSRTSRMPTGLRTVQWYRDGAAITGAGGLQHTAADAGSYSCTVTASNVAGSTASAPSTGFTVTAPSTAGGSTAGSTSPGTGSAASPAITVKSLKVSWKLTSRTLTGTFSPVSGAASYAIRATGATRRSGSCRTISATRTTKRKITCRVSLKTGRSRVTVTARNGAKATIARARTTKTRK